MADSEQWFFIATCKKCGAEIKIMECPPPKVTVAVDREEFDFECPVCKTNSHYTMHEVTRGLPRSTH